MCNHDDDKVYTPLGIVSHDVYMCECGALINLDDARNFSETKTYPMSPQDLIALLKEEREAFKLDLKIAVYKAFEEVK